MTKSILIEAEELTTQDRLEQYGEYRENATRAVEAYRAIMGKSEVSNAAEVAMFQACHKLAREGCKPKRDNIVDACGYLKLYYNELHRGEVVAITIKGGLCE